MYNQMDSVSRRAYLLLKKTKGCAYKPCSSSTSQLISESDLSDTICFIQKQDSATFVIVMMSSEAISLQKGDLVYS